MSDLNEDNEVPRRRELAVPDGGYGWICVLGQFLINGFTWGTAAAYSVYLSWYLTHNLFPDAVSLDFAVIGGLNFAVAVLVAPFVNLAVRHFGIRIPMFLGVVCLPAGLIAASFAQEIWHLYLSQGFLVGLGIGLLYIPATAVIPQWFSTKRSLANGICAAGSGIGGCTMCFATQAMIDQIDYTWSLRISAVVVFFVNLIATLLVRSRNADVKPTERMFDYRLLLRYNVLLLLGWSFIIMFGYITLMFSLPDFASTLGRSASDSATVAAVLNIGAAVGRPAIGYISDRFGRVETTAILTAVCSVLCFAMWIPTTDYATLIAFALLSGAILGVFWAVRLYFHHAYAHADRTLGNCTACCRSCGTQRRAIFAISCLADCCCTRNR